MFKWESVENRLVSIYIHTKLSTVHKHIRWVVGRLLCPAIPFYMPPWYNKKIIMRTTLAYIGRGLDLLASVPLLPSLFIFSYHLLCIPSWKSPKCLLLWRVKMTVCLSEGRMYVCMYVPVRCVQACIVMTLPPRKEKRPKKSNMIMRLRMTINPCVWEWERVCVSTAIFELWLMTMKWWFAFFVSPLPLTNLPAYLSVRLLWRWMDR